MAIEEKVISEEASYAFTPTFPYSNEKAQPSWQTINSLLHIQKPGEQVDVDQVLLAAATTHGSLAQRFFETLRITPQELAQAAQRKSIDEPDKRVSTWTVQATDLLSEAARHAQLDQRNEYTLDDIFWASAKSEAANYFFSRLGLLITPFRKPHNKIRPHVAGSMYVYTHPLSVQQAIQKFYESGGNPHSFDPQILETLPLSWIERVVKFQALSTQPDLSQNTSDNSSPLWKSHQLTQEQLDNLPPAQPYLSPEEEAQRQADEQRLLAGRRKIEDEREATRAWANTLGNTSLNASSSEDSSMTFDTPFS